MISEIRIARLGPRRDLDNKPDRTSAKLRRDPPTAELVRPRSTEVEIKGYTVSSRGVIDGCRDGETGSWCRDSERHNRRRRAYRGAPQSTRLRRTPEGPERAMSAQAHSSAARRSRDEREPQEPSENQARKGVVSNAREQPPVGGHQGGAKPQRRGRRRRPLRYRRRQLCHRRRQLRRRRRRRGQCHRRHCLRARCASSSLTATRDR